MDVIRVSTWNELQDELFFNSWMPKIERFRSPYAFRGQAFFDQRLDTSLMRLGGDYEEMERHILRNFRKYARHSDEEMDSIWNWLSIAKHHGLPTRLLDWSFSPFVALHFATQHIEDFNQDGAIWQVDYHAAQRYLPEKLKKQLAGEGSDVFTVEMLATSMQSLEELERMSPSDFVIFFEPPSLDERIVNQFALFSMASRPEIRMDTWLEQRKELSRMVVIPADLKWEVRDKLDQANITERVLFPGLDGLSAWLKRMYSSRK